MKSLNVNGRTYEPSTRRNAQIVSLFLASNKELKLEDVAAKLYPSYSKPTASHNLQQNCLRSAQRAISRARLDLCSQLPGEFLVWLPSCGRYRFFLKPLGKYGRRA